MTLTHIMWLYHVTSVKLKKSRLQLGLKLKIHKNCYNYNKNIGIGTDFSSGFQPKNLVILLNVYKNYTISPQKTSKKIKIINPIHYSWILFILSCYWDPVIETSWTRYRIIYYQFFFFGFLGFFLVFFALKSSTIDFSAISLKGPSVSEISISNNSIMIEIFILIIG